MERKAITFEIVDTRKIILERKTQPFPLTSQVMQIWWKKKLHMAIVSEKRISMIIELNIVILMNSNRFLDSGATIHVCHEKEQLTKYQTAINNQKVLMENHNFPKVLWKGSVEIQFTFGNTYSC